MIPTPTPTYQKINDSVDIYTIKTKGFKTARLSIYTMRPAHAEDSPMATLLFNILRRGTCAYPKLSLLNQRLDELYGTTLTLRNFLIGDTHVLSFTAEMLEETYLPAPCDVLQGVMEILSEMLHNPLTDGDGGFRPDIVEQEKISLCDSIRADINDTRSYASARLRRIMCQNEPYGVSLSGSVAQIMAITPQEVTRAYAEWQRNASWAVYYTGQAPQKKVTQCFLQAFGENLPQTAKKTPTQPHIPPKNPVFEDEDMPVEQGKLCMSWTKTAQGKDDHAAAVVLCEMLGVMQSAIFFRTIREQMGLCYYCDTSYEGSKGILSLSCGIHPKNRAVTQTAVLDILEKIRVGELDPQDVMLSQISLQNVYRQIPESPASLEAYWFRHKIEGPDIPPDEMLKLLLCVTPRDVVEVANAFVLDTVYFLNATHAEEAELT